jgi:hypothetical protein
MLVLINLKIHECINIFSKALGTQVSVYLVHHVLQQVVVNSKLVSDHDLDSEARRRLMVVGPAINDVSI